MHRYFLVFISIIGFSAQQALQFPAVITTPVNGTCPSAAMREATRQSIQEQVESILAPSQPPCPCGSPGPWTRIVHLNMSDISQQCPSNWNLISAPVRGCGHSSTVILPPFHPMVSPTLVCVGEWMPFREAHQMPLAVQLGCWKVHTLTESPSHMELQAHDSTFGHLLQLSVKI